MSMTTSIEGVIPANEEYKKMLKIYNMCEEMNVSIPDEVEEFFDGETPSKDGMSIEISSAIVDSEDGNEYEDVVMIDVEKLPKNVKFVKIVTSY